MKKVGSLAGGVNGATGRYALPAMTDLEVAKRVLEQQLVTTAELREFHWWVERYGLEDPHRAPAVDADVEDLSSTGWGVLFSSEVTREIRQALEPLLDLRREQAGERYREFEYLAGQSKQDFLATHGAFPGPADPDSVPYYLLLVGSPEAISFELQQAMDIQYAVGRIWFDRPEDFAAYAHSVVRAEKGASVSRSRSVTLFGVEHPGDRITQSLSRELVSPLAERLGREAEVRVNLGAEATKSRLDDILKSGSQALLLIASHGVSFPAGDVRQLEHQGALLLGDWPGPEQGGGPISPDFYLSAEDLGEEISLAGSVVFLLTDFGGGTPTHSDFFDRVTAPRAFMARLPQRLLSLPRGGALAVVSRVDRTWNSSFSWSRDSGLQVLERAIRLLLNGYPLGAAMEFFSQRFAEQAIALASLWEDRAFLREDDLGLYAQLWMTAQDLRNLMLFGDPAVRLSCDAG